MRHEKDALTGTHMYKTHRQTRPTGIEKHVASVTESLRETLLCSCDSPLQGFRYLFARMADSDIG
jgi:hypothetical protein